MLKGLLRGLPPFNYKLLSDLFGLLVEVAQYASENLMSASNLATIFGPTLLPTDGTFSCLIHGAGLAMVTETPAINTVTLMMITEREKLFTKEVRDPINTAMTLTETDFLRNLSCLDR